MSQPYYEHAGIQIFHGDCREILPSLPACDLVFTSPPYGYQRDYERGFNDWDDVLCPAITSIQQNPDAQIFVNLGLIHRDGEVWEYWIPMIEAARAAGMRLFGWYVWDKGSSLPGDWSGRFGPAHEWVFHLNRQSRKPNKILQCRYAGDMFHGRLRRPDGTMSEISRRAPVPESKIPDSVVRLYPARSPADYTNEHPAVFPWELPAFFIEAASSGNNLVVDPFCGSGTTLRAAKDLGRRAIGIEIEEKYCEIAAKRLSQEVFDFEGARP